MVSDYQQQEGNEEIWKTVLIDGHPMLITKKKRFSVLPSDPRCKLCAAPFRGIGGKALKLFKDIHQSKRNPLFCNACDSFLKAYPGGIETPMTMMFVDIRNSVGLSASMPAKDFRDLVSRLRNLALESMSKTDGSVLEFSGDGVIAVWPPGIAGKNHAEKGISAARKLLSSSQALASKDIDLPFGIGVHTGTAFMGTIASASNDIQDISAFGYEFNKVARLSDAATSGEALISEATVKAANMVPEDGSIRKLDLKGIDDETTAFALS